MIPIRVAQRGRGILREFNEAGVLSAADVHVAARLGRLAGEDREPVLFAAALAVRAVRSGSVCLDLTRMRDIGVDTDDEHPDQLDLTELPWPDEQSVIDAVRDSPLVLGGPAGPLRPLRLTEPARPGVGPLLYLDRYYRQEHTIRRVLTARAAGHPAADPAVVCRELDRLFGPAGDTPDRQRLAAALAATRWTTVVAGGPGTGKTHTIARILALLVAHRAAESGGDGAPLRIALAAPTGKAAARLQEDLRRARKELREAEDRAAKLTGDLAAERGRIRQADSERRAERRRLEAEAGALREQLEAMRRAEHESDRMADSRLWLLMETLSGTAVGLRRELGLEPVAERPADYIAGERCAEPEARETEGSRGLEQGDPQRLDHLLSLPNPHLIVDGYNVTISAWGETLTLEQQRNRLVQGLGGLATQTNAEITVVFDGADPIFGAKPSARGVRVLFSAKGEIADDVVVDLARVEPKGRPVIVVSSDREVADRARRHDAYTVPSPLLVKRIQRG